MGKDSLIKSTSKKKTTSSKEEEAKKKTTTKAAAKPTAARKATAKKTKSTSSTPKTKSAAAKTKAKTVAAKPGVKKKAAAAKSKTKRPAAAKKPKKATIPELLAKKFDQLPGAPKPKPAAPPKVVFKESPPIISTSDPQEAARIRALLVTKFSMAEIKTAAQPPKAEKPEVSLTDTPAPEPIAQVETPAAEAVETPVAPSDEPPVITTTALQEDTKEPMSRGVKYSIAAAVLLMLIVLGVSHNNSTKYYIQPKEGAIEIWKGRFSPKDRKFFMVLHGVQLDQEVKELYSQSEVFPIIFDYYLDKADTLLEVPGLPDFEGIKEYLHQAQSYVTTPEMRAKVAGRLNSIERMALLYKADVAISKNTEDSLRAALKHLKKASGLVANPNQQQEIDQKIELVKKLRIVLKSEVK